ncbi:hypothetical protein OFA97_11780 [Lactiplantibacillus plantarum]|nr:hypothetical protein OFA97_11780 [Lactiplantibacillus plantarum]
MPMVLMAQATKPEQLQQLQTTYPDWTFKDAAAVTAADYDQIEVMYGNHPLLTNQSVKVCTGHFSWRRLFAIKGIASGRGGGCKHEWYSRRCD